MTLTFLSSYSFSCCPMLHLFSPDTEQRINLFWATDSFTLKHVCVDGILLSPTVCFGSVPMLWEGGMEGGVTAALLKLNIIRVEEDGKKMLAHLVSSIICFFLGGLGSDQGVLRLTTLKITLYKMNFTTSMINNCLSCRFYFLILTLCRQQLLNLACH